MPTLMVESHGCFMRQKHQTVLLLLFVICKRRTYFKKDTKEDEKKKEERDNARKLHQQLKNYQLDRSVSQIHVK